MRIGLLGVVEAWPDGTAGSPVSLGGVRQRGLLARLALDAGRPVGVSALVDDLWGDTPPESANALQALVSRLRRAIGPDVIGTDAGGYRLRIEPGAVDVFRFRALVADADAAAPAAAHASLREALALWRGPALADIIELPFAEAAAARLRNGRASAVERIARLALQIGSPASEIDALTAQLDAEPLRESTAALLARALHATGRQADALAVLDRIRDRLVDELGVDPGPEIEAARLAVLRGEITISRPAPTFGAISSFIGRERDVERIRTLLSTTRLITLTGPGGAGKTRLAREVVADGARRAVLAELAPLTGGDQLPAALLTTVGGPDLMIRAQDEAESDTTSRLVTTIGHNDLLLVLDNCEHLIDAAAVLAEQLLRSCPRLQVLATSREPLEVPGEVLHPVDALSDDDAMRLFTDRGAAARPGFALTPAVEPAVAEICRRLDGQPLPIELAAARLRTLTPAEIAARLDDRFRLLTSGARTAVPRHQTLRAVVDWSWDLLEKPERAVARRLGVFAGGATAAAAERVCSQPSGPAPEEVFELLAALVDKSLVVAVPQADGAPTRYRMLETIREYANERLDEAGERAAAVEAHAEVVLELAEAAEPHLRSAEQLEWMAKLHAEDEEIDIALRRAVADGNAVVAHRLIAAMGWLWLIRGLTDEAIRWSYAARDLEGPVPDHVMGLNLAFLALADIGRGEIADADVTARRAIHLAADLPSPRHPIVDLLEPMYALFGADDDGPIRRMVEQHRDPWVRAFGLLAMSGIAENSGEIDEQRELLRSAHQLFVAVGDRFGLGMVVHSLGELEDFAGEYDAAADAYDEAIALATELGNVDDLPQFLVRRAVLEARRGDAEAARRRIADIDWDEVAGPVGLGLGALRISAAQAMLLIGDLDAARDQLDLAVPHLATAGPGRPQRNAFYGATRAALAHASGDERSARSALAEAVHAAVEAQDGPVAAIVAEAAAQLTLAAADPERAAVLLGVAAAQRGTLDHGNPHVVAIVEGVRNALGPAAADEAMRRGRELPRDEGLAELSRQALRR